MNPEKTVRFSDGDFVKSSYCTSTPGGCVEVARKDGVTAIRDAKNPDRTLLFASEEWHAFVKGIKAGEFDDK